MGSFLLLTALCWAGCRTAQRPLPPLPPGSARHAPLVVERLAPPSALRLILTTNAEPVGFTRAGTLHTNALGSREWWFTNRENWTAWIFQKSSDGTNWTYFLAHDESPNQWLSLHFRVSEPPPYSSVKDLRLIRWK